MINSQASNKVEIAKNEHELNKSLKEHVINHEIKFPNTVKDNYIFPPLFYERVEKGESFFSKISSNAPIQKKTKKGNISHYIATSCKNDILSVEYSLKIKLKISSFSDEIFFIPIDFCLRPDEKDNNNNNLNQMNSFNYMNNNMNNYNMNNYYINNNNNNNYNSNINNYNNNINNYNNNINIINNNNINANYNINNNFSPNNINNNQQYYNQNAEGNTYIKPYSNNNAMMGNKNNLNIPPQNQIFDNNSENFAPPPVFNNNYSNANKNENDTNGFEIIDPNKL